MKARSITIVLDREYKDEGLNNVLMVIRSLSFVADAKPGMEEDDRLYIAQLDARREIREKIVAILFPKDR